MKGQVLTHAAAGDREGTDFYPTPESVTVVLVKALGIEGSSVWEPACGAGHMVRALQSLGCTVIASDLHPRGCGIEENFLTCGDLGGDWIITNPPFMLAAQFIRRCLEHGKPFAMLLKSQYWHSASRRGLFDRHRPTHVFPLTWRPDFLFGSKAGAPTMEVLWTVWGTEPAPATIYQPLARHAGGEQPLLDL